MTSLAEDIQRIPDRERDAPSGSAPEGAEASAFAMGNESVPKFDLEGFLPYQLSRLANRMSRALEARYSSIHGLAVAEWRIMLHLSQSNVISMNELKCRVEMHKSRVSRATGRLERAGFVRRSANEDDRRVVNLELTESGRLLLCDLLPLARQFQTELAAALGENKEAFRLGLDVLMKNCTE